VAGVLGDQLITRMNEATKAGDEFAGAMDRSSTALDKLLANENAGMAFGRSLQHLKEKGTVADVTGAQESNTARIEELQNELQQRRAQFDAAMEQARRMGGVAGPGGSGIFMTGPDGRRILQGAIPKNAEVDESIVGSAMAKNILEQQNRITELDDLLRRAGNRAERLNEALADAKGREEGEKRNAVWQDWSDLIQKDTDEIERLRQMNLTPAEKTEEEIRRLTQLKERNPNAAATIDLAVANLRKPEPGTPAGNVPAALFGSSAAFSAIANASRVKDAGEKEQEKTNELLEKGLEKDDLTNQYMREIRDRFADLGIQVGVL
jgi:hypothetical protein